MQRVIFYFYCLLFFLTPLILWPYTSEVFEFNKMIFVYLMTILIVSAWAVRVIIEKKFIFRRTLLDIPLLIYLGILLISTLFSIDPRTSWLGYYSRFNGGFLSILSYSLLYWAFVSNIDKKQANFLLKGSLVTAALVSLYGVMERFGIDKNVWVQDVVNRVFSTLGQPNWLAAYLVALLPVSMMYGKKDSRYNLLSVLFFITLLLTKSRSGILGFLVASLIFWGYTLYKDYKKNIKPFLILNTIFLLLFLVIQTPFTKAPAPTPVGPALETGGTESGEIRKIVWKGALLATKANSLIGSGPETFAFIYPKYRPVEHNLVSEWDFIYNKAHNEYLNLLTTTGLLGLISYLIVIAFSVLIFIKSLAKEEVETTIALFAGYCSILVTNFFGFSVVTTQFLLFLFPAVALALSTDKKQESQKLNLKSDQKLIIAGVVLFAIYLICIVLRYLIADLNYTKAKAYNKTKDPKKAMAFINKSLKISPREPIFHLELAESYLGQGVADKVISEGEIAMELSPNNVNIKKIVFSNYIRLAATDSQFLLLAIPVLEESIKQAPNDAKLIYNLGLTYARIGQAELAYKNVLEALKLKPNYKEARLAHAVFLITDKKYQEAKDELNYILNFIDPNDEVVKKQLEEIQK